MENGNIQFRTGYVGQRILFAEALWNSRTILDMLESARQPEILKEPSAPDLGAMRIRVNVSAKNVTVPTGLCLFFMSRVVVSPRIQGLRVAQQEKGYVCKCMTISSWGSNTPTRIQFLHNMLIWRGRSALFHLKDVVSLDFLFSLCCVHANLIPLSLLFASLLLKPKRPQRTCSG